MEPIKVDFHLSYWLQGTGKLSRGHANFALSQKYFPVRLDRKTQDNQSNQTIFATSALLLFISSQSNRSAIFASITFFE